VVVSPERANQAIFAILILLKSDDFNVINEMIDMKINTKIVRIKIAISPDTSFIPCLAMTKVNPAKNIEINANFIH
jgi:hypothetical protein